MSEAAAAPAPVEEVKPAEAPAAEPTPAPEAAPEAAPATVSHWMHDGPSPACNGRVIQEPAQEEPKAEEAKPAETPAADAPAAEAAATEEAKPVCLSFV